MKQEPFWERAYQDIGGVTFGKPSKEFYELLPLMPSRARVLDMGCGDGRNALFLAEHGCDVTAVDISAHGIEKVRRLADMKGISIRTEVRDMRTYEFQDDFDLIISHGCLHLIQRPEWQRLIATFKSRTTPGGYNVITVFTDAIAPPDDLKELCVGLFNEGELDSCYADWELVFRKSYVLEDQHPGSPPHRHPINKLVVRNPKQ